MSVSFLKKQKPACTHFPYFDKFSGNLALYAELSKRSEDEFNENLLGRRCPKADRCFNGCKGRPIPKYKELEELYPEIQHLATGDYKGREVYFYEMTLCDSCPIRETCTQHCASLTSFLEKDTVDTDAMGENSFIHSYDDDIEPEPARVYKYDLKFKRSDIPWEVVSTKQRKIIELRTLWLKDWNTIGIILNLNHEVVRTEFRRGIKKLKSRGADIVKEHSVEQISSKNNLTRSEIYAKLNMTKKQLLARIKELKNESDD